MTLWVWGQWDTKSILTFNHRVSRTNIGVYNLAFDKALLNL